MPFEITRGTLSLIISKAMRATKTYHLIRTIKDLEDFAKKRVLVLIPSSDSRSGSCLKSRNGEMINASFLDVKDIREIWKIIKEGEEERRYTTIAFDEIQFYPAIEIYRLIDELLDRGYDVIAAGLALDFKGEPFGAPLWLIGLCTPDNIHWLNSYCTVCGRKAELTPRFDGATGQLIPDSPQQIVVDKKFDCNDGEKIPDYLPRCRKHKNAPEKVGPDAYPEKEE